MKLLALALFLLLFIFPAELLCAQESAPAPESSPVQNPAPAESSTQPPPAAPTTFGITGIVRAGKTHLPGATVTASNSLTGKKFTVATAANGVYTLAGLPRGRYVVRVEFMGFAVQTQEVVLKPETPAEKFDAEMVLASREQDQSGLGNLAALVTAGRGFQSLSIDSALSSLAGGGAAGMMGGGQNGSGGDMSSLPLNGAGAEGPTESVSITGAQGRTQDFGGGSEDDIQERIQEFRDRAQREGGGLQGGGQGAGPGPGGFGGGPMIMRLPRNLNINQPHGMVYASDDSGALDAKSYSLTGLATPKASYNLPRFGVFLGGPLNIPKIFNGGNKWFFFGGWNGNRGSTPYDAFSTVPTLAERSGDFSAATYKNGSPVQIFNPTTKQQFQSNGQLNVIDSTLISGSAKALLAFIPLPNLNTATQNFHYVTSGSSSSDSVNFRLIHNFNAAGGPFMNFGGPGGPGGGAGGRRRATNNINFGMNWTRSSTTLVNPFPSLAGGNSLQGLNASAGWTYGRGRATNNFRVNYNHNHVSTTNLFSNVQNVAGNAGIGGVSTNPFDWGLPGISFTTFAGFSDPIPRRELDQTFTFSDTLSWSRGKHNWRFGGDYRRILQSFRSAKNAEGSFVFTGFATSQSASAGGPVANTGYDFADFLLGLPQQTSLQSGTNSYDFRANAFDLYAQDDFRFRPSLSLNLGLRYEYNGPYTERHNQIANLAVASGFTAAQVVLPAGAVTPVPVNGAASSSTASLINPDRNNFAPRIGVAWRPIKQTVIRGGYGINYNLAQYGSIIQNFAFQPPFALTSTNISTPVNLLTLQNGFPATNATVTNNFAVDPNYRLGYVQIWNLDIQRQLPANVVMNLDYNGSKGTRLDVERAITIPGVQPFIYESSAANSVFHSGSIRLRKRMARGFAVSGTYAYSKSIDDASSIGGGGTVVAQNPFDIAADRGLSSFDLRHKFFGNWVYELPFGENHRFAQRGPLSHILNGWQWSGDFTIGSGLYFTPRVLGNSLDIGRGVSGSLRANATGAPISLSSPSTLQWFNTAAFCSSSSFGSSTPGAGSTCANPSGSSFGDAGRNIILGPGQITFDMNLSKTITIKESRALELRIQAANAFNTAHFTGLNTIVNSLTYGQVTSVGSMRRITLLGRFRF